jgi:regulator of sirC expression with transglutaminase-like and TPR domain
MKRYALILFALEFLFGVEARPLVAAETPTKLTYDLKEYLKRPESQIKIVDGALWVCKQAHPELDIEVVRKSIQGLAVEFKKKLAGELSIQKQAAALADFLFEQHQFTTPQKDNAEAFLLSDVVHTKRGNCLGLSLLCLSIAEEAGLKVHGVPVPSRSSECGHMLVRFVEGQTYRNFDPGEKGVEHPNAYYQKEFKITVEDLRSGYVLGNAKKREVLALLLVNLGGTYVESQRLSEAVALLEAALELRAESAAAHSNLAAARLRMGDKVAADKSYAAALKCDPKFFPARVGRAEIALKNNDASAARQIEELVALEPTLMQVRTLQANLLVQKNDIAGAIKTLKEISALPDADVTVWNNLAKCYSVNGELAQAENSYRQALTLEEHNVDAHLGLGRTLMAQGKKADADVEFAIAVKLDPKRAKEVPSGATPPVVSKAPEYPKGTSVLPFKIVANRIFVSVRLNDKMDVDAILDTGTEVTLLNGARIKLDGLPLVGGSGDLMGGMVGRVPVKMVSLSSLKMGETIVRNQAVGRTDQGPGTKFENIDFVLGMDVLCKFRFTVDFEHSVFILWPAGFKPTPPAANVDRVQVPALNPESGTLYRPYVAATINQKNIATFLVDTGADMPMFVAFKKPADLGLASKDASIAVLRVNDGNAKQELPIFSLTFESFQIGPKAIFNEVAGRVIDASSLTSATARADLKFLNVIGTPFLKTLLAIHIDIAGRTVSFDRVKL